MIPESQHAKTQPIQVIRPCSIFRRLLHMLTTIHLQNEPLFQTDEIDDVLTDDLLPSKLMSLQLPVPQQAPKQPFGIGLIPS